MLAHINSGSAPAVGWGTLALINAGLAQTKNIFIVSLTARLFF
jgi:hypothetical protein